MIKTNYDALKWCSRRSVRVVFSAKKINGKKITSCKIMIGKKLSVSDKTLLKTVRRAIEKLDENKEANKKRRRMK